VNSREPALAGNPALVVMAAGVVTASAEFAVETVGEFAPVWLPDTQSGFSDPSLGCTPTARR